MKHGKFKAKSSCADHIKDAVADSGSVETAGLVQIR